MSFNFWDIIILIIVIALVGLAFYLARDRKKNGCCGSGGCSGNCSACGCTCSQKHLDDNKPS